MDRNGKGFGAVIPWKMAGDLDMVPSGERETSAVPQVGSGAKARRGDVALTQTSVCPTCVTATGNVRGLGTVRRGEETISIWPIPQRMCQTPCDSENIMWRDTKSRPSLSLILIHYVTQGQGDTSCY